VILCAEIDLSGGRQSPTSPASRWPIFTLQESYVNIANVPLPGWVAILFALAACFALGLVNAVGVTLIGIPSFIMTLAMMQIGDGISAMLVRGQIAYNVPPLIRELGSGASSTSLDRHHRGDDAAGGSHRAHLHPLRPLRLHGRRQPRGGEFSGVNVRRVIGAVMVIGAVCSGIAGMLGVAYFGSAQQNEFTPYLLDAIAAVVVGGTSLFGGRGGIGNTIVGLFVLGVLNNGLDHVQIDPFLKVLIRGLILLLALVINVYAQRLRATEQAGA
jgi:ribose transport system permease protein